MSKIAHKITERYEKSNKKSAIAMLRSLASRIERDELKVDSAGFWAGMAGSWTLKVNVSEPRDSEENQ